MIAKGLHFPKQLRFYSYLVGAQATDLGSSILNSEVTISKFSRAVYLYLYPVLSAYSYVSLLIW
jgi:hypothetical protein